VAVFNLKNGLALQVQGVSWLEAVGKFNGGNRCIVNNYFNPLPIYLPISDALLTR